MNVISRILLTGAMVLVSSSLEGQQRIFSYLENRLVETFDPLTYNPNPVNDRLSSLLYASLFRVDEYSQPVPDMAETIKPDPSLARTFIVTLRKGLKWSNGTPVSSEDALFTIDLITNKETDCSGNPPLRYLLSQIKDKRYLDPLKLSVTFDRKLDIKEAMVRLTFPVLPKKILKKPVLKPRDQFSANPVGSGPFHIAPGFAVGAHLLRNPDYHQFESSNKQFVEEVQMVGFPDDISRVQSFKSGKYHLMVDVPWESLPQIRASFKIYPYESLSFHYLGCNFKNPLLAIPKVRKALSMAIDRSRLIASVYSSSNAAEIVSGPFPSGSPYIDPAVIPDPYDPEAAKRLLREAGLTDNNNDGLLEYMGKPIDLRLLYVELQGSEGNANRSVCEFIEGQFRTVGIKVTPMRYPSGSFAKKLKVDHDFDLVFNQWRFTEGEGDPTTLFSTIEKGLETYNYIGYSDQKVDLLFRQFKMADDPDTRKYVGRRIHMHLAEERPYLFLWSLKYNSAFNPKLITNISINPFAYFDSIMKWRIKK